MGNELRDLKSAEPALPIELKAEKKPLWRSICVALAVFAFFISQVYLHYQQLESTQDLFVSDLKIHLRTWLVGKDVYSLCGAVMVLVYKLAGSFGFSVTMSCFQVASVLILAKIIQKVALPRRLTWESSLGLSLLCSVETAVYLPRLGNWYIGSLMSAVYHNTTISMMQPFALLAFLYFMELYEEIHTRLTRKKYVLYVTCLTLSTCFKPSFVFVFAFALLILLMIDFIQTRCRNLKNEVLLGISVFPSIAVCLVQSSQLFGNEAKIIWSPLTYWHYSSTVIQSARSLLFPVVVLLLFGWLNRKTFAYQFSALLYAVALFQYLCLAEAGSRTLHGNLGWGAFSCGVIWFGTSAAVMLRDDEKRFNWKRMICMALLVWHAATGVIFLLHLLSGGYPFM